MNPKLFKLMEEVVLVIKQIIIRFTTVVHNLATFPGQITSRNRNLLAKMTKNLAINIRYVVQGSYAVIKSHKSDK